MKSNKFSYYMITKDSINPINNELQYKTGIYQWINVFNGKCKHIRNILPDINKYDNTIFHIILTKYNINIINIIRKKLNSKSKIIVSFYFTKSELFQYYSPDILIDKLNNADLIFGTDYYAVASLENILKRNVYEIPSPANLKWLLAQEKHPKKNILSVIWDKNITDIKKDCSFLKETGLKLRLLNYNKKEDKNPEITKSVFDELIPHTNYKNFCSLLSESKLVFCPYDYKTYYEFIINCAVLETPVLGSNKIENIQRCFPYTCFNLKNKSIIKDTIKLLLSDKEFYQLVIDVASYNAKYYNFENSKKILLDILKDKKNIKNIKENYTDEEITFYLQVYKDYKLANWCLNNLRTIFPKSRVIVISDGDNDFRYNNFIKKYNAEYIEGERLFTIENGGLMLKRMFDIFLKKPTKYFISIDTDTHIHRRFKYLPESLFFGRYALKKYNIIQGGFVGINIEAVNKIINSKILESRELLDYKNTWVNNKHLLYIIENKIKNKFSGLIADEIVLGYCFKKLGIFAEEFDEVYSEWKIPFNNKKSEYAVTHPCKIKYYQDNE